MRDTMVIALEAAWELDPVRLEKKLWRTIFEKEKPETKCRPFVDHTSENGVISKGFKI